MMVTAMFDVRKITPRGCCSVMCLNISRVHTQRLYVGHENLTISCSQGNRWQGLRVARS